MHFTETNTAATQEALIFAIEERRRTLSEREWRFRLRGYGYDIRRTARGRMLTRITTGVELGALDA